jgi:probable rRNA maturation factor
VGAVRSTEIDVQTASDAPGIPDDREIRRWICAALDGAGYRRSCVVSVRVVDAEEMRDLNREFRGKDSSTNVLSFAAAEIAGVPADADRALGDLVICAPVLHDEALAQHKPLSHHWSHIVVHGTLHLLGFDHMNDIEAAEMETLETRILAAGGVPDPYSER